jgi:acyl-CoA synthetase (AMP-forming)/AMP-acid ligase II/pimeloyl-ACP methyl ester carboxylesterase
VPTGDAAVGVANLAGVNPTWSRRVRLDVDGSPEMHVLDRPGMGGEDIEYPTVVCLHGNPTWSVLWTSLLERLDPRYRVVAVDHLDMGWSQRVTAVGDVRRFATRVTDVDAALRALDVTGPVVLVGHDWGGAIAMGWAVAHPERVAGLVLVNTGIAVPQGRRAPWLIRLAAQRPLLRAVTRQTSLFTRATYHLPGRGVPSTVRQALLSPYRDASRRIGIAGFVADVPFDEQHPSARDIAQVAEGVRTLDCPVLLVWGARDPVFDDTFAHDLRRRFRHVEVHRDPRAGHLSPIECDLAGIVQRWLGQSSSPIPDGDHEGSGLRAWTLLERRANDTAVAFHDDASGQWVTFAELYDRVMACAGELLRRGVRPGQRVGLLVPPSVDLVVAVYACWRLGAATVIADRGLGLRGLGAALRSARVHAVVGVGRAVRVARVARWAPGAMLIDAADVTSSNRGDVAHIPEPDRDSEAAVLFTSGATGPAKGVRYTHRQLEAQRDALMTAYSITSDDRLVAAFAPFALYGPAMGITSALPDVDVTAPATLTAAALEQACAAVGATLVFASPAALTNVVATASGSPMPALARVRTVMSAGAPIPVALLDDMARLVPAATLHTPYGMTEVLPVADVDLRALKAAGEGHGVCVGRAVPGCQVIIAEPGDGGVEPLGVGRTGEVLVHAPWCSAGYDVLADTQRRARPHTDVVWHRSGDLGHLDEAGRLWIEGRVVHGIATATGLVTPVPLEWSAQRVPGVRRAAAVGVGPFGVQQIVLVVERSSRTRWWRRQSVTLAPVEVTDDVRRAVVGDHPGVVVAAVLAVSAMPVDIRHNAKIDRAALAALAEAYLAGQH